MRAVVDGVVNGLVGAWVEDDLGRPVTSADDVQHGLVGGPSEVCDVGAAQDISVADVSAAFFRRWLPGGGSMVASKATIPDEAANS